ncbi:MAG: hypothetical protein IPM46_04640 [Flavobacteriales bacterium]|nr:hypothetical protein [Flavobacteriales bacterium]
MNEYHVKPEDRHKQFGVCLNLEIDISAKSFRTIEMKVRYDKSRGLAEAVMEVRGDQLNHIEGPFSYTVETDPCYGDAGWYRVQLVESNKLYVYYEGLGRMKHISGYEVWKKRQ